MATSLALLAQGRTQGRGMPWFEKGSVANYPVICPSLKGSLMGIEYNISEGWY